MVGGGAETRLLPSHTHCVKFQEGREGGGEGEERAGTYIRLYTQLLCLLFSILVLLPCPTFVPGPLVYVPVLLFACVPSLCCSAFAFGLPTLCSWDGSFVALPTALPASQWVCLVAF